MNGKGNVNSSEMTTVPEGYKLRVVGDYYYNGGDELRVEVIKEKTQGGRVNVVYYCEEDNTVWAPGEIWAKGLVNGKGNVNSSEKMCIRDSHGDGGCGDRRGKDRLYRKRMEKGVPGHGGGISQAHDPGVVSLRRAWKPVKPCLLYTSPYN